MSFEERNAQEKIDFLRKKLPHLVAIVMLFAVFIGCVIAFTLKNTAHRKNHLLCKKGLCLGLELTNNSHLKYGEIQLTRLKKLGVSTIVLYLGSRNETTSDPSIEEFVKRIIKDARRNNIGVVTSSKGNDSRLQYLKNNRTRVNVPDDDDFFFFELDFLKKIPHFCSLTIDMDIMVFSDIAHVYTDNEQLCRNGIILDYEYHNNSTQFYYTVNRFESDHLLSNKYEKKAKIFMDALNLGKKLIQSIDYSVIDSKDRFKFSKVYLLLSAFSRYGTVIKDPLILDELLQQGEDSQLVKLMSQIKSFRTKYSQHLFAKEAMVAEFLEIDEDILTLRKFTPGSSAFGLYMFINQRTTTKTDVDVCGYIMGHLQTTVVLDEDNVKSVTPVLATENSLFSLNIDLVHPKNITMPGLSAVVLLVEPFEDYKL